MSKFYKTIHQVKDWAEQKKNELNVKDNFNQYVEFRDHSFTELKLAYAEHFTLDMCEDNDMKWHIIFTEHYGYFILENYCNCCDVKVMSMEEFHNKRKKKQALERRMMRAGKFPL